MAILYSKIEEHMACPKEVVLWNYWDREHLTGTHFKHYANVRVVEQRDDWCVTESSIKLPLIPLKVKTSNFCFMKRPDLMKCLHFGKLAVLEQDFHFEDVGPEACKVTLENRLNIAGPQGLADLLQPLWQKFSRRWFYATWHEDVPMRLRRWKVWKLGFRDFVGIDYINEKTVKPAGRGTTIRAYPFELPVKSSTPIKSEGWPRLFSHSVEVGYGELPKSS